MALPSWTLSKDPISIAHLMQQKQIQNDRIDQIEKLNRSAQKQKIAEILKAQMENKKKIEQLQLI